MKNYIQPSGSSPLFKIVSLIFFMMTALGLLLLLFYLMSNVGVSGTEAGRGRIASMADDPGMARFFLFLQHFLLFICVPLVYQKAWYSSSEKSLFTWGQPEVKDFLRFALFLILIFPVIAVTTSWISHLDLPEWLQTMDDEYIKSLHAVMSTDTLADVIITLIIAAVMPGIGEELLFRGTLQKELINHGKNPHAAIWLTAILFSLLHFQASGFLAKWLIGMVLGYAYHFTGSLWVPMVLHFLNNAAATIAFFLYRDGETKTTTYPGFSLDQLFIFSGSIFLIIIYFNYLAKSYKKE